MDRLEALGIAENTIVLFTSDNGPHGEGGYEPEYFDSNGPLRGMKRDLYEGGIRVPHLTWWPGRLEAGSTTDAIGYFGDYMATFAELANADVPADATDSQSLVPVLQGDADMLRADEPLYWEFYARGSSQAVRLGKWKAVRAPMVTGAVELYDMEADLSESNNVADAHPDVVERMAAIMKEAHTPSSGWDVPSPSE
jgi:arylsulfatase A-like enzyme